MTAYTPTKKPTLTLAPHKITGRQVLALNAINADIRVEDQIARQLAANDAKVAVDKAAQRARMKRLREERRERAEALIGEWAAWHVYESSRLGHPSRNMLAAHLPLDRRPNDDEQPVAMTITESQASRFGHFTGLANLIQGPDFPTMFRDAIFAVYVHRKKQGVAAAELGMTDPEFTLCLQMAREHVAQQWDDRRLGWR